jgi:hypothetical protein
MHALERRRSDGGWWLTESNRGRGGAVIAVTMRGVEGGSVEEAETRSLALGLCCVGKEKMHEDGRLVALVKPNDRSVFSSRMRVSRRGVAV